MQYTSDQRTMNPDKNMYHLTTVTEERPTVPKITKTNENLITFSSSYERGKDTKRKSIILNTPVKKIQSETLSITTTFHVKDLSSIKADSNILDDLARLKVHLLTPVVHSIPVDINIKTSSYILYLEPQKNTSLYESIVRFYNSSSKFGYNEAHQVYLLML